MVRSLLSDIYYYSSFSMFSLSDSCHRRKNMQLQRDSNVQQDEAFLSLLSSQRELLSRLSRETASRQARGTGANAAPPSRAGVSSLAQNHSRMFMNRSISERRSSLEFLFPKRFSMGLPGDFDDPFRSSVHMDGGHLDEISRITFEKKHRAQEVDSGATPRRTKRRLSSLGFLSSSFFDDHLEKPSSRRSSILSSGRESVISFTKVSSLSSKYLSGDGNVDSASEDDGDQTDDGIDDVSIEPLEFENEKIDPIQLKSLMENFNKSMEHSQKSQQDIHDWDRKMGLKRSHSKTMRLSSRSRKKLRSIVKKEICLLAPKL
jgi:hypothetical protein